MKTIQQMLQFIIYKESEYTRLHIPAPTHFPSAYQTVGLHFNTDNTGKVKLPES